MPRKFKIAIAIPPYNDVDVFTNDVGMIAVIEKNKLVGFNVAAGGGMGTTHGNPETYPRLGTVLGFVKPDDCKNVVYAIVTVQRDYGNRSDRKLSRLKYTIDRMGVDVFKAEVEKRSGIKFAPAKKIVFTDRQDDYGWHQNHEGLWYYTAFIENGRIYDDEKVQFKQAFYEIAQSQQSTIPVYLQSNLIIGDITE